MHEDKHLHVIGDEGTKISNMAPFCLNQCFPGGGGGGGGGTKISAKHWSPRIIISRPKFH